MWLKGHLQEPLSLLLNNYMKSFESYFNEDEIVAYLCKFRAKIAKSRNKKHLIHQLTESDKYNYHVNDNNNYTKYERKFLNDLNNLLPTRKNWVKLGKDSRIDKKTGCQIPSFDKNYYSLKKTIKNYRQNSPREPFLIVLDEFIANIKNAIASENYRIAPPVIYPKLKQKLRKRGKNKCRPISLFSLKDRVILSITNKFLTDLFDQYFEECSYAFRSPKNNENNSALSHHDCIKSIKEYKAKKENKDLWVVECDMEKFYDTVNHDIIKILYSDIIDKVVKKYPDLDLSKPNHIFDEFLNCYAFNKNVLPLKNNQAFWEEYNIPDGEFEWVEEQFEKHGYYKNIERERIGVPQGGALSGLIANIVLDFADKNVKKNNVFYIRFCDDMLIIDPDRIKCNRAKESYINSLHELILVPHGFCDDTELIVPRTKKVKNLPPTTLKPFWAKKSKGPYKWGSISTGGFPWIGFVGYELHHQGDIRVRKKSLQRELNKQKEVIRKISKAISKNRRKGLRTISESAIHRLIGMSVGRVTLKNYDKIENDLCWKNGFRELSKNKHSISQMKELDRSRNKLYFNFVKKLQNIEDADKKFESKPRQIIHFNKPFSYYYQVLERHEA